MRVWIDQDLCTGDGQCVEFCPDVFFLHDDGGSYVAYVRNAGESGCGPDGAPRLTRSNGIAEVPPSFEDAVADAAHYCPGACIFVQRSW